MSDALMEAFGNLLKETSSLYAGDVEKLATKLADAHRQLQLVRMLAQQHNTPSVNPGAHALAGKILEVVG